jgi:hypothetical protein
MLERVSNVCKQTFARKHCALRSTPSPGRSQTRMRILAAWVLCLSACNRPIADRAAPPAIGSTRHTVTIHKPLRLEGVFIGPAQGKTPSVDLAIPAVAGRVNCDTCHSLRSASSLPKSMQELDEFHQGLVLQHGDLSCASCHALGPSPKLHLADARVLERPDALELCRQCHGPQYRDYEHGAHGGMAGYWDLRRGPRTRNHCVDCHDPHWPAIRQVIPAPPPRDRFIGDPAHSTSDSESDSTTAWLGSGAER